MTYLSVATSQFFMAKINYFVTTSYLFMATTYISLDTIYLSGVDPGESVIGVTPLPRFLFFKNKHSLSTNIVLNMELTIDMIPCMFR